LEILMPSDIIATPVSKTALWTGRVISALAVLGLLFSGVMKFSKAEGLIKSFEHLGWPEWMAFGLGILEISCTVIYMIPRTAVLGAILLAGYLGGATATHVRVGDPFIFPPLMGILLWLGLYLREPRLRALIPLRSPRREAVARD
jgi:uncharacterized membrane protein YphA (DoxX/SURF4 family)